MNEENINKVCVLIEKFFQDREMQGYSPETIFHERQRIEYFLEFLKARDEENLGEITLETLNKFQMHIYKNPGKSGKPLALAVQGLILIVVRSFFRWLVRNNHILADPASGLELPRIKQKFPKGIMTKKEIEKVLAAPDVDTTRGLRDRAIMEVLYSTGMRNKELRELKVYDVNLPEGQIHIRQGKGGKDRIVPMGEIAAKYVELYLHESRQKILNSQGRNAHINEDPGYLFLSTNKTQLVGLSLRQIIKQYALKVGLKNVITPHSFRHTCATHLLKGHANIRHIQILLGHRSLVSTQVYTHLEIGDLKKELKRCHPRERAC